MFCCYLLSVHFGPTTVSTFMYEQGSYLPYRSNMWFTQPFNSHEWLRQNFFLQYQYNVKQTGGEIKEKYKLDDN